MLIKERSIAITISAMGGTGGKP